MINFMRGVFHMDHIFHMSHVLSLISLTGCSSLLIMLSLPASVNNVSYSRMNNLLFVFPNISHLTINDVPEKHQMLVHTECSLFSRNMKMMTWDFKSNDDPQHADNV